MTPSERDPSGLRGLKPRGQPGDGERHAASAPGDKHEGDSRKRVIILTDDGPELIEASDTEDANIEVLTPCSLDTVINNLESLKEADTVILLAAGPLSEFSTSIPLLDRMMHRLGFVDDQFRRTREEAYEFDECPTLTEDPLRYVLNAAPGTDSQLTLPAIYSAAAKVFASIFSCGHGITEQEIWVLLSGGESGYGNERFTDYLCGYRSLNTSEALVANMPGNGPSCEDDEIKGVVAKLELSGGRILDRPPADESSLIQAFQHGNFSCVRSKNGAICGFEGHVRRLRTVWLDCTGTALRHKLRPSFHDQIFGRPALVHQRFLEMKGFQTTPNRVEADTRKQEEEAFRAREHMELCRQARKQVEAILEQSGKTNPFVGETDAIIGLYPDILRAMERPTRNVAIYGEVGSGKEVLTELIAAADEPAGHPVLFEVKAVDASDVAHSNSLLFGILPGTATGVDGRKGLVAEAAGGTLIFDGMEYSTRKQQEGWRRLLDPTCRSYLVQGESTEKSAQCRFILLFNKDPEKLVRCGKLLSDVWSRCEIRISIPPLRERREDIPLLVRTWVEHYHQELGSRTPTADPSDIAPPADLVEEWKNRDWSAPEIGNVRELRRLVNEYLDKQMMLRSYADTNRQTSLPDGVSTTSKGGRPPGSKTISDDDLAAILHQFEGRSNWRLYELFNQIDMRTKKNKKPMKRTPEGLCRRVSRISHDSIWAYWGEDSDVEAVKTSIRAMISRADDRN